MFQPHSHLCQLINCTTDLLLYGAMSLYTIPLCGYRMTLYCICVLIVHAVNFDDVCTLRIACTQVGPQTSVLGQKARDNGFTVSLVARLHKLYSKKDLKKAAEPYQAAMLTNHRSHPSILCLPNSLFYHCSLQVRMHTNT